MPKRNRDSSALSISMPSSLPMLTFPQLFPEAVRAWAAAGTKTTRDTALVRQNARNHLVATGWSSFGVRRANGRMEFRYMSPAGKVFNSLRSACQSVDASQTLAVVVSQTTSLAVVPKTTMTTSLLPPLRCMKSFISRNKRRKMRMRSMKDIMKDDRSVISGAGGFLGRPIPVTGRGDLSWSLLKAELKDSKYHCQKLDEALEVMHECFEASIDPVTHTDLAEEIIFNEELDFYTVVLEMQDKVVTVASVRVHEGKVAEVPLAATAFDFRRQGMCKVLMSEIENWLRASGIKRVVLPSTKNALKTWTSETMGFLTMGEDEKADLLIAYDCLDFQGTTMCEKQLLKRKNKESDGNSSDGSTISHELGHACIYVEG